MRHLLVGFAVACAFASLFDTSIAVAGDPAAAMCGSRRIMKSVGASAGSIWAAGTLVDVDPTLRDACVGIDLRCRRSGTKQACTLTTFADAGGALQTMEDEPTIVSWQGSRLIAETYSLCATDRWFVDGSSGRAWLETRPTGNRSSACRSSTAGRMTVE